MVRFIVTVVIILLISSCQYRFHIVNGKKVFVGSPHKLYKESDENFHDKIDTNAVYIGVKDYYWYLKFDSKGGVHYITNGRELTTESFIIPLKSTNRGRYFVKGSRIKIEIFLPGDTFFDNVLLRSAWRGEIKGDTLNLKYVNGTHVFVKSKEYYFENGLLKSDER
jgi:hypothetical protein